MGHSERAEESDGADRAYPHPHGKSQKMLSYQGEEFGYVLKGAITIVQGNKKYKVKAKETFYMSGDKSHYLYNHGNSEAKVLWVTTPPMF